jgi:diguanylate cyclase (GGDEF)-like protein
MRILLVEDEPDAARMVAKGLREHAYAVDVVADGEAACYQATIADYDAIVLDVLLPLKDGLEVCRHLRKEGATVPILMLTARDAVDARIAGLDSGADDYLTKPFDRHELQARLTVGRRILRLQEELIAAREALRAEATHDALTGLWNRRGVLAILSAELERAARERSPLAAVVADLDHFKAINDTRGHLAGDEVLREVGRRLRLAVRPYDGIGRLGGEEFLVVLPGVSTQAAAEIAERVRAAVADTPIAIPGGEVTVTLSAGVAVTPGGLVDPDPLLAAADGGLYEAKRGGRNRVVAAGPIGGGRRRRPAVEVAG